MTQAIVEVRNLHKSFGQLHVLKGVSLKVYSGEVVVIIGPSGSGKSTLLRCLNYLEQPSGAPSCLKTKRLTRNTTCGR